jgi:hypothetical protein
MKDFITQLACEGETMLFLKKMGRGFVPHLPEQYDGEGEWFGNTGVFILDRMTDRLAAKRANIEHVALLMLDDIGTKSRAPALDPTWKIETSPGNFQWVYVYSEQPTKGDHAAALKAMATMGYTDPGAINPVRNFRLPGSVNSKKKFTAVLHEFHPERAFTLAQICDALGVVPDAAEGDPLDIGLTDSGEKDAVFLWLGEQHLVLDLPNSSGWAAVVCPNAEQHTNDDPAGRYFPATRAFKCLHGHCVGIDSTVFLGWIAEQGGPVAEHGLRDDLLVEKMKGVAAALTPTAAFPDRAAQLVAKLDRIAADRVEKSEWHHRFAYVQSDDSFFDLETRAEIPRSVFNALFRHVACRSVRSNRLIEASIAFDELRKDSNARVLSGITYAAGESVLCTEKGLVFGNKWIDQRRPGVPGDVTPWLKLAERLIPDDAERGHVFDVMAFKLQQPRLKINHAILHGGRQGVGKDTFWHPFLWSVGNVALVQNNEIGQQWGYAYESEVIVLNELRQSDMRDQRALENVLKPLIAAPPTHLSVNRKGKHPYDAINRLQLIAFSNDRAAISLATDDRRWFVLWSDRQPLDGAPIWAWYEAGGREAVAAWLYARDASAFNPGARPPSTEAKEAMASSSLSPSEDYLMELIEAGAPPFDRGVVAGPWPRLLERVKARGIPEGVFLSTRALQHALTACGWVDKGLVHSRVHPTKRHAFCAPALSDMPKGELRAMIEPGLTAVK